MRRGALLVALLAGACHEHEPCRAGTLFLDLTVAGVIAGANGLLVEVQAGATVLRDRVPYAGQSPVGLEVRFPNGYPSGQSITVTVTVQAGSTELARGSTTARLSGACARLPIALAPPTCTHVAASFAQAPAAPWTTRWNAAFNAGRQEVSLTDGATAGEIGGLFYATAIDVPAFDARFDVFMGDGSDGIALLFTPELPIAYPTDATAAGIGYQGFVGWAIELDTYRNNDRGDLDGNHVGLMRAPDGLHMLARTAPVTLGCNCVLQTHARLTGGHILVEIDGLTAFDSDIPGLVGDGGAPPSLTGTWIVGLTSANGGSATAHGVRSFTLDAGAPGSCF
jgi:hypothetical protein